MDILSEIRSGNFSSVYLIWGDNAGEIVEFSRRLRRAMFGRDASLGASSEETLATTTDAFNHERFDGPYVRKIAEVLQACEQIPMAAPYRLVELSQPEAFGKHRRQTDSDDLKDSAKAASSVDQAISGLIEYFERPNPCTILLITSTGLAGTSKLVKAAKRAQAVVEIRCEIPKEGESVAALLDLARQQGIEISPTCARQLIAAVGPARSEWSSALERAVSFAGGTAINESHVQSVVSATRQVEVFALTDAIGRRDLRQSLEVLRNLFGGAERDHSLAMRTLGLLIWQMRRLCVAKFSKNPEVALASKPFAVRQLVAQAREFRPEQLRSAYAGLLQLDKQLKGSSAVAYASPLMALQRWVFEVCGTFPSQDGE